MAGNGWKWLEWLKMDDKKNMEMAGIAGNGWK